MAATLKQHSNGLRERYPKEVEEIEKCLYVDDIITGGCANDEVLNLKESTISVFEEDTFELHKWHSNEPQLGSAEENNHVVDHQQSYAKEQLGVQHGETKLLELSWNKHNDILGVAFSKKPEDITDKEGDLTISRISV